MQRNYRHKGVIQQLGSTLTDRGQRAQTWSTFATVFYSRQDASAGEVVRGRQMAGESTHRLETHWLDGVTNEMRLVDSNDGRIYEFKAVRDAFDNRRTLQIDALESV